LAGSWKKSWVVRSYPDAVIRMIKFMPRVYVDGSGAGVLGWVGRTFSHQRRDFKPKPPELTVDKGNRLIFQHPLLTPFTYTVEVQAEDENTRVEVQVKVSGTTRDTSAGEQVVALFFALTKALEPD